MAGRWDEILAKNDRYAILWYGIGQISRDEVFMLAFYDDITAAGIEGAKPFADFQPCGYANTMAIGKHPAEFPDSLVGKKLVHVYETYPDGSTREGMWEFLSKNTVRSTHGRRKAGESEAEWVGRANQEDENRAHVRQETWTLLNAYWISDHIMFINFEDPGLNEIMMTLPGMTGREVEYCRELYRLWLMWDDSVSLVGGNNYCVALGEVQLWEPR